MFLLLLTEMSPVRSFHNMESLDNEGKRLVSAMWQSRIILPDLSLTTADGLGQQWPPLFCWRPLPLSHLTHIMAMATTDYM